MNYYEDIVMYSGIIIDDINFFTLVNSTLNGRAKDMESFSNVDFEAIFNSDETNFTNVEKKLMATAFSVISLLNAKEALQNKSLNEKLVERLDLSKSYAFMKSWLLKANLTQQKSIVLALVFYSYNFDRDTKEEVKKRIVSNVEKELDSRFSMKSFILRIYFVFCLKKIW